MLFCQSSCHFCVKFAWAVCRGAETIAQVTDLKTWHVPDSLLLWFTSLLFWIWLSVSMKKSPFFLKSVMINLLACDWLSPAVLLDKDCCLCWEPNSSITSSLYSSKRSRLKIMFTQLLINYSSLWLNMNGLQILYCAVTCCLKLLKQLLICKNTSFRYSLKNGIETKCVYFI